MQVNTYLAPVTVERINPATGVIEHHQLMQEMSMGKPIGQPFKMSGMPDAATVTALQLTGQLSGDTRTTGSLSFMNGKPLEGGYVPPAAPAPSAPPAGVGRVVFGSGPAGHGSY